MQHSVLNYQSTNYHLCALSYQMPTEFIDVLIAGTYQHAIGIARRIRYYGEIGNGPGTTHGTAEVSQAKLLGCKSIDRFRSAIFNQRELYG